MLHVLVLEEMCIHCLLKLPDLRVMSQLFQAIGQERMEEAGNVVHMLERSEKETDVLQHALGS